ncbi:Gtr1/RagA G protein Gtr2 [Protomyces lactucae-debilis]|uniref:GTP-binding protein n=1 Tax=Protomyces lactucae-debilis TaxID=2754530 RepID=A0A1Y2F2R6_PROLT|nr:Gtr1/RagA G protein Gtr2 [Protomyces lactucae-debilis]ORY77774.1 Gtr1/RagA G protein Gtr2 [Protomyces lactucae-debilis]
MSSMEMMGDPPGPRSKVKLLLLGLRRSGKSSIQKVVFHKMAPNETLFLESTGEIIKENVSSFIDFQVWDFPGQIDFFEASFDAEAIFGDVGALIFVIDAQDEYQEALQKLHMTITKAVSVNPGINIEVFVHKIDGLSDDYKIDAQRDVQQRTMDELTDIGMENVVLSFHLTSIFDHSIFEAFSKVIQKLIPQLPTLENLLNVFCANSIIEKAFLFDVMSKIYIATDSSPVDVQSYEICSDYIDVILDISEIYGYRRPEQTNGDMQTAQRVSKAQENSEASSMIQLNNGMTLYLREINQYLALICLMRDESHKSPGLLEYNVQQFQRAIEEIFEDR